MYPTSTRFAEAVRNPPAIYVRVEVWYGGARVDPYGDDGLPVHGGEISVDGTKMIRRTLTGLRVDATDETWDLLSPVGTELRVWRGFRFLNGEIEAVPVGRFIIDDQSEDYGGDWGGQVGAAPDRMVLVQRARFTAPRSIPAGGRIRDEITTLLSEVLGPVVNSATSSATVISPLLFERDRAKAVAEMCESIGAEAFIASDGTPIVRDVPKLAADPVWTVDTGNSGVLYKAGRIRSRERTYSGVVASGALIDGAPLFTPVTVWDEEPNSPTYHLGPFGKVPYFLTSSLLGDTIQAEAAARTRLAQVSGLRAQIDAEAECHPALGEWDTVALVLPPRQWGRPPITERHMLRAFTVPLTPDGTQRLETASTAADVEDSA